MSEKKHCPACGARLWGDGKECTACKREIKILCWEVESADGVLNFRGKKGIIIGALVVGAMYGIPGMGVEFRTVIAMELSAVVSATLGWTVGYGIGALIGLRKPRAVTLEDKDSPG